MPGLRAEAARISGPEGLALADAFIDIVMDGERVPESWPLDDVIDLLCGGRESERNERLFRDLCVLSWRIDALADRRAVLMQQQTPWRAA